METPKLAYLSLSALELLQVLQELKLEGVSEEELINFAYSMENEAAIYELHFFGVDPF